MPQTITVKVEGALLDQILVGVHGFVGQRILELTLEANPGLSGKTVIPIGEQVIIPDMPAESVGYPVSETVSLFD